MVDSTYIPLCSPTLKAPSPQGAFVILPSCGHFQLQSWSPGETYGQFRLVVQACDRDQFG